MKNERKRGISLGTWLMLLFTAVVFAGSLALINRMGQGTENTFSAETLISTLTHRLAATDAPTSTPAPQNTIKTTTVTMTPAEYAENLTEPTTAPVRKTFTMTLGGLMSFQSEITDSVYREDRNQMDFTPIAEHLAFSVYSDLNIVTLNNLLTASYDRYADISTVPDVLQTVKALGMDYVMLNHSHILDKDIEGVTSTVDAIAKQGLGWGGIQNFDEQGRIKLLSLNGAQIAVLGYADTLSAKTRESVNQNAALSLLDVDQVKRDVDSARAQGADFVLVSVYWGKADTAAVTQSMRNTAQDLAAAGADMIMGVGPQAVLPVEMIETVDAGGKVRNTVTAYSVGTLLHEYRETRAQVSGALLHVKVTVDAERDGVTFDSISYTPTYIWKQEVNGEILFRILPSTMEPPAEMNQRQREIMSRALVLIDEVMASGPAVRRQ